MKKALLLIAFIHSLAVFAQKAVPEIKVPVFSFEQKNFKTESGVILPLAILYYGTYGHLNEIGRAHV